MDSSPPTAQGLETSGPRPKLRTGTFALEALNGLGTAYYNYYIFFFMQQRFGFTKADNLLLTVFYGFTYMVAAAAAGRLSQRLGRFRLLRLGFAAMLFAMLAGALVPAVLGSSPVAMWLEFAVLILWTVGVSTGWPILQALLSSEGAGQLPRIVGIYNLIWASTSGIAFLTGGTLFASFPIGTTFLFPAAIHVVQLVLLGRLEKRAGPGFPSAAATPAATMPAAPPNPASTARAVGFVRLAWIANPFAYVAMYGFIPVIPQLSRRLGLSTPQTGVAFSIWFWSRLVAFLWFWLWPGWHYRFRWLLAAFAAMIACFFVILLDRHLWVVIAAQLIFGLCIGLIYYSSLFYSMDAGASGTKKGGIHEAAIGLGIGAGPAVGFAALRLLPGQSNAGTWYIGAALILGFLLFLITRLRWPRLKTEG